MSGATAILVVFHVTANVVWIGSIMAVAVILASQAASVEVRGRIGVEVYKALAAPAFVISFLTGAVRLALDTHYYFVQTKFMHGKLFLVLVVIGLHHVIGARAKKMANGVAQDDRITYRLAFVLMFAAAAAVLLVLTKPF